MLRLIGDPETRYREDPVRMLRAVRFAAKLGFNIHPDTAAPIPKLAWMLDAVPPARLFDEVNKMFLAGSARNAFDLLYRLGLLEHLFPDLARVIHEAPDTPAVQVLRLGLQGTDERVLADKSVTPTFLFAVLLWPAIQQAYSRRRPRQKAQKCSDLLAICERVTARQQARVADSEAIHAAAARDRRTAAALRASRGSTRAAPARSPALSSRVRLSVAARRGGRSRRRTLAQWWTDIQTLSGGRADRARRGGRSQRRGRRWAERGAAVAGAARAPPA